MHVLCWAAAQRGAVCWWWWCLQWLACCAESGVGARLVHQAVRRTATEAATMLAGTGLLPQCAAIWYNCTSVTLARLDDRHASRRARRIHYTIMSRSQGTQRWPAHPGPRSPPFGNQRPDACMRVLVDLQGPPKGPPSPLSHTVLHAPPPLRVATATREVPPVPRSVCDLHPHPCVHRIWHA